MHTYEISSAFKKAGQAFKKNALPLILVTLIGGIISMIPQAFIQKNLPHNLSNLEKYESRNENLENAATNFQELLSSDPSTISEEDVEDSMRDLAESFGADYDTIVELGERAENGEEISGLESLSALGVLNPFGNTSKTGTNINFGKIAFFGLISMIIGLFVQAAIITTSLDAVMGRKFEISNITASFSKIPNLFLAGILIGIVGLINFIPILGQIIYIILVISFIQTPYLIFEEGMGAIDAFKKSYELMKGNKLKMFLTLLIFILLYIIGLVLIVGWIVIIPYLITVLAQIYKDLSQGAKA